MTNMIKYVCSKWLKWLKLLVDVALLICLNQKLYYLYEYIMTLWNFNISEL
jgi:TRAP-type C4-dicarboxylate transport system permease small subunit